MVHEDDEIIAIKDINPQAPIHVLVIPKLHIATVNDLEEQHIMLMGQLFMVAKHLAAQWHCRAGVSSQGTWAVAVASSSTTSTCTCSADGRTGPNPILETQPGPMPYCSPRQPPALYRSVGLASAVSVPDFTSTLAVRVGLVASGRAWRITKNRRHDHTGTSII
jgi:hypothetical protein